MLLAVIPDMVKSLFPEFVLKFQQLNSGECQFVMKKILVLLGIGFVQVGSAQGVTIGSNNPPDPSAVLDLQSNGQGLLLPRLSTAQRDSIVSPALGLLIVNTTTECIEVYFNNGWMQVKCSCTQPPAQPGSISGPAGFCAGQSGVIYSVNQVPGASQYFWSVPPGATIVSGQGTHQITVNFGSSSGHIGVTANNTCGASAQTQLAVILSQPVASFSPAIATINQPVTFQPQPGYSSYSWTFQGGNIGSSTAQNPMVTWSSTGTYTVSLTVTDQYGCSASHTGNIQLVNCIPFGNNSQVFNYTGSMQTWIVPVGVCSVNVQCYGAQGGANPNGAPGGLGGSASGGLSVNPGDTLYIFVGGQGSGRTGGGYNGGGDGGTGWASAMDGAKGGGASDVRYGGTALQNRVIVAAGGGGAGGRGGAASGNMSSGAGGGGGGYYGGGGGAAFWSDYLVPAGLGQPGTQNAGGAGGVGIGGAGANGAAGTLGQGGNGGSTGATGSGSGGGTDYSGGHGGGLTGSAGTIYSNGNLNWRTGGSGAGGSSYVGGLSNGSTQSGVRSGNGQVIIYW